MGQLLNVSCAAAICMLTCAHLCRVAAATSPLECPLCLTDPGRCQASGKPSSRQARQQPVALPMASAPPGRWSRRSCCGRRRLPRSRSSRRWIPRSHCSRQWARQSQCGRLRVPPSRSGRRRSTQSRCGHWCFRLRSRPPARPCGPASSLRQPRGLFRLPASRAPSASRCLAPGLLREARRLQRPPRQCDPTCSSLPPASRHWCQRSTPCRQCRLVSTAPVQVLPAAGRCPRAQMCTSTLQQRPCSQSMVCSSHSAHPEGPQLGRPGKSRRSSSVAPPSGSQAMPRSHKLCSQQYRRVGPLEFACIWYRDYSCNACMEVAQLAAYIAAGPGPR